MSPAPERPARPMRRGLSPVRRWALRLSSVVIIAGALCATPTAKTVAVMLFVPFRC